MNAETYQMLDPTAQLSPERRARRAPTARLQDATIGLLSISIKTLPLGTAYTMCTGIGAVGAFVVGVVTW